MNGIVVKGNLKPFLDTVEYTDKSVSLILKNGLVIQCVWTQYLCGYSIDMERIVHQGVQFRTYE